MRTLSSSFEIGPVNVNPNRLMVGVASATLALSLFGCGSENNNAASSTEAPAPAATTIDPYPYQTEAPLETTPPDELPTTSEPYTWSTTEPAEPTYTEDPYTSQPGEPSATATEPNCPYSPEYPRSINPDKIEERIITAFCSALNYNTRALIYRRPKAVMNDSLGSLAEGTKVTGVCATIGQEIADFNNNKSDIWAIVNIPPVYFPHSKVVNEGVLNGNVIVQSGEIGHATNGLPNCTKKQLRDIANPNS